jgi:DegV family protein with EDD domain
MERIRIITDVTSQLPPDVVEQHRIIVLPLEIQFGDEQYVLNPGDSPDQLYRSMLDSPARVARVRIPPNAVQTAYRQLNSQAEEILVITGSSKLSEAYSIARAEAQAFLGRCRITVMDSMSTSKGLGLVVETAARAAQDGHPLDEIVRLIRGMLPHIYLVFFVDRLDYLEQGGRIGPAQALLGTMLRIKPLLLIEDGEIIPLEKVRTQRMAIEKLADFVGEFATIQQVHIMHGPHIDGGGELVKELRALLELVLPKRKFPIMEYDPLLACHIGPGAVGVTVYEGI